MHEDAAHRGDYLNRPTLVLSLAPRPALTSTSLSWKAFKFQLEVKKVESSTFGASLNEVLYLTDGLRKILERGTAEQP